MDDEPTVRVFVTKYALTSGITEEDVWTSGDGYAYGTGRYRPQYCKGEWHTDRSSAIDKANEMKRRKLASLAKQVTNLHNIKFE